MNDSILKKLDWLLLPLIGVAACLILWHLLAGKVVYLLSSPEQVAEMQTVIKALPEGEALWKQYQPFVEKGRFAELKALPDAAPVWEVIQPFLEEKRVGLIPALPNVHEAWISSKPYILSPFVYRGELDQGILRFTWLSLILVAKG